jgi:hypothetical protein
MSVLLVCFGVVFSKKHQGIVMKAASNTTNKT